MAGDIKPKPQVEQLNISAEIGIDLPNSLVFLVFNKHINILRLSPTEAVEVGQSLIDASKLLLAKEV